MKLREIDKGIAALTGIISNVNDRVQELAVAIIVHANGEGAGDVSRALKLVQALPNSFRREYLIRYFRHFGSIGIDLRANKGAGQVRVLSKDNREYRGFDVDGAKANNWYDAFDAAGNRAPWYTGPNPTDFEPNTLVDFGGNIANFVKRQTKALDDTKEVNGRFVPLFDLTDDQKNTAKAVLTAIGRVAAYVGAVGQTGELAAEIERMNALAEQMKPAIDALNEAPAVAANG